MVKSSDHPHSSTRNSPTNAVHLTRCSLHSNGHLRDFDFGQTEDWAFGHISNCHLSALQMLGNNTQICILNSVARLRSWLKWLMGPSSGHSVGRADRGSPVSHLAAWVWNMLRNPHLVMRMCKFCCYLEDLGFGDKPKISFTAHLPLEKNAIIYTLWIITSSDLQFPNLHCMNMSCFLRVSVVLLQNAMTNYCIHSFPFKHFLSLF